MLELSYYSSKVASVVPRPVIELAKCLFGESWRDRLSLAIEIYAAFGLYEEVASTDTDVYEFETSPNKVGLIAITGGAGATFTVEYMDETTSTWEEYDNQPTAVDGDAPDVQIVWATKRSRITQSGGAAATICLVR